MPNQNDYSIARDARKEQRLPESDRKTLNPKFLLGHENHFDPNVITPEQQIQKGVLNPGGIKSVSKT